MANIVTLKNNTTNKINYPRTDGILAMVLPTGFRPTGLRHTFSICTPGSGSSKCIGTQIGTDGAVVLTYGASDQYVLLNLTFRV